MREQVSETPFHRFPFHPFNISLSCLAQCLPCLPCPSLTSHAARCTRQPPRLQPLVKNAPGFFFSFSVRGKRLTQRKTCKWDLVASAQKAGCAGLEVVQNLCRYFPLVCIDLLPSRGKQQQQQQQRDAREEREGGGGGCGAAFMGNVCDQHDSSA